MTAREMLPAIGASVAVRFEDLTVNCTVRNVKSSYGRTRLLVAPTAGSGEQWIELPRVAVGLCAECGASVGMRGGNGGKCCVACSKMVTA